MVIRPKSIATVVVFFAGVPASSSTPTDASVRIASVRNGMISDTAPTKVVLPAPNPPAITIFVDAAVELSERAEATQSPSDQFSPFFHQRDVMQGRQHAKITRLHQVADQNTSDSHRKLQSGSDLCHRWRCRTELYDVRPHVAHRPGVVLCRLKGFDRCLERQLNARSGAPGRKGIRPYQIRLISRCRRRCFHRAS